MDTSVLVPILRRVPEGSRYLKSFESESVATTSITAFELFFGALISKRREENLEAVQKLVQGFPVFPLTIKSAFIAARIQHELRAGGNPVELNDIYIASIAIEHGAELATANTRHFSRISRLKVREL
ncbi:MAG: type II toxin-antitoxin system VapC family toxin [Promethearchaeota archaeon]